MAGKKRNPFDITAMTSIVRLLCEKIFLAVASFPDVGNFADNILVTLSSQDVRSFADFNRLKASLHSIKVDASRSVENSSCGDKGCKPICCLEFGDYAVHILYNIRYFLHFLSYVHQSSVCSSILQDCCS